jgi:hypothetical protein
MCNYFGRLIEAHTKRLRRAGVDEDVIHRDIALVETTFANVIADKMDEEDRHKVEWPLPSEQPA